MDKETNVGDPYKDTTRVPAYIRTEAAFFDLAVAALAAASKAPQ